jgi:hypothetical protein
LRQRQADEPVVPTSRPILLSAVDDRTKASGLYRVTVGSTNEPVKVVMMDKAIGVPIKARDATVYVFTTSRFDEFPICGVGRHRSRHRRRSATRTRSRRSTTGAARARRVRQRGRQKLCARF